MGRHVLRREIVLPRPLSEVFAFFSDAANLERITPAFMRFQILTKLPIEMKTGAIIDYRIALGGLPMTWRTRIESFEPGVQFIDVQERGPYKLWRHTHRFVAEGNATRMIDEVEYEVGFGIFGELARRLFVTRTVEQIFDHRTAVMQQLFGVAMA
jgi:ligand-binding SRPBCC domain-containing protein